MRTSPQTNKFKQDRRACTTTSKPATNREREPNPIGTQGNVTSEISSKELFVLMITWEVYLPFLLLNHKRTSLPKLEDLSRHHTLAYHVEDQASRLARPVLTLRQFKKNEDHQLNGIQPLRFTINEFPAFSKLMELWTRKIVFQT